MGGKLQPLTQIHFIRIMGRKKGRKQSHYNGKSDNDEAYDGQFSAAENPTDTPELASMLCGVMKSFAGSPPDHNAPQSYRIRASSHP